MKRTFLRLLSLVACTALLAPEIARYRELVKSIESAAR